MIRKASNILERSKLSFKERGALKYGENHTQNQTKDTSFAKQIIKIFL